MKKDKSTEENSIKVAYSYITMAKIALIDSSDVDSEEMQNVIDRLSDVQIRLAPLTVKKIEVTVTHLW